MSWGAATALAGVVAVSIGAGPAPPERSGPWHQLGAAVASKQKQISMQRTAAPSPKALAFVVTGPANRALKVFWYTYCEIYSDDDLTEDNQGSVTGTGRIVRYPTVLKDATLCFISVVVRPPAGLQVTAASFSY